MIKLTSIKAHFEKITSIKFLNELEFITSSWDKTIKIWEILNKKINLIKELHHDRMVDMVYLTPDNRYIISIGADSSTRVWEYDNFKLIMDIPSNDITSTEFILSRDKKFIAVPIIKDWRLYHNIFQIPKKEKLQTIETYFSAPLNRRDFFFLSRSIHNEFEITRGLASPNHNIFLRKERESVDVYPCNSKKKLGSLESPKIRFFDKKSLYNYIFSQDSTLIASPHNYYDNFRIIIWDAKTLKILHNLRGHSDMINTIQISNDKKYVVSGSADKKLKIWDLKEGGLTQTLDGHHSYVESIAIYNENQFIISGSYDGELILWKKN